MATIGASDPEGKPIQIIRYDKSTEKPIYMDLEALATILLKRDIADKPVVLFSIAGAYRTGKSFLLNFFLRYLKALESGKTDNWLGDRKADLKGFKWEMGINRATDGILLWSRPFMVKDRLGREVALLLMDTQGLFDGVTTRGAANAMISLSTLLSSMQVFNVKEKLDESNLTTLELFAETGMLLSEAKLGRGTEPPFQRATFLVRDWMGRTDFKCGEDGGRCYIEEKLEVQPEQADDIRNVRINLRSCFQKLDCYLRPHPGLAAVGQVEDEEEDAEFRGKLNDLEKGFCKHLKLLAPFFFDPKKIMTKCYGGVEITGRTLMTMFEKFTRLFADGNIPFPATTRQALIDQYNMQYIDLHLKDYGKDLLTKIKEESQPFVFDELQKLLLLESVTVQGKFSEDCRGTEKEMEEFKKELKNRIDTLNNEIELENNALQAEKKGTNRTYCLAEFKKAKEFYRDNMDQVAMGDEIVDTKELQIRHLELSAEAFADFDKQTSMMGEEKMPFRNNLQLSIDVYMKECVIKNEIKRKLQASREKVRLGVLEKAKQEYIREMEQVYDVGKQPKTEREVEDHSDSCLLRAKTIYRDANELVESDSDRLLEELDHFCKRELERFKKQNQFNLTLRKKEDRDIIAIANHRAIRKYQGFMLSNCSPGKRFRSKSGMTELHNEAVAVAIQLWESQTKDCDLTKYNKNSGILAMLKEELPPYLIINENLNPDLSLTRESPC